MKVELVEITEENVDAVLRLRVAPEQEQFVASNAISIAQAHFSDRAWFRAIRADGELVGFVMLSDDTMVPERPSPCEVGLWRLMVSRDHQGKGVGRQTMLQIIDLVKDKPGVDLFTTSYAPGPGCPEPFYRKLGFEPNGFMDEDEIVLEYKLR